MKSIRTLVVAAAAAVLASTAGADNLLNNAGFENPLGFDFSNPTNWNGFFGGPAGTFLQAFNDTGAAPRSGDKALVTTIRPGGHPTGWEAFVGHVQTVFNIVPGAQYELAVWARTNPLVNNGAEFRVEWQNAAGTELGRFNMTIDGTISSDYQRFSFMDQAPADAAKAQIVVAVQSFQHTGDPSETSVAWDDAEFGIVPTPGAAALLSLGGLLAARRRR